MYIHPEPVVRGSPTGWDPIWKPIVTAMAHAGVGSRKGSRRWSLLNWALKVEQEFARQEKRQRKEHGHRLDDMWPVPAQGVHWAAREVMRVKGQGLVPAHTGLSKENV